MSDELVILENDGPVRIVTLNRPDARNAFNDDLKLAFVETLRKLSRDTEARAVVLTGAGKAFSAGGDITNFINRYQYENRFYWMREARILQEELIRCHLPVVAAVNGPAVGLGCSTAMLCDIVYMADNAFYADPHASLGLVAADGGALLWPMLIGFLRAKEYLFTGERIPAQLAYEFGMCNRVLPPEEVMPKSLELAHKLAGLPWQSIQETKRSVNMHLKQAALSILDFSTTAESESFNTDAVKDFMAKFLGPEYGQ
ncbi:MAG: enoyl-CoA hydratase/isomerase family protein [Acidimicrobiia bacterium]